MGTNGDRSAVVAAEKVAQAMRSAFEAKVRESGAIAFRGGVARRDCPAHPGSAARTYWLRGYDAAKRAARKSASYPHHRHKE